MLSQRLLVLSISNYRSNISADNTSQLLSVTNEFVAGHHILLSGDEEYDVAGPDQTFEAELSGISSYVEEIRDLVYESVNTNKDNYAALRLVSEEFLSRMDLCVSGLADRSGYRVKVHMLVGTATNILLFFVGLVMYKRYNLMNKMKK